ncbi:MAG: hypothetical protein HGB08_00200 [Candidatus Moranbacteria bacterium]|nr:hypothetical protein [Candidatus Moranbacteria bacterium]
MKRKTDSAIRRGLIFLSREQRANGSFFSLTSEKKNNLENGTHHRSTFPASLILSCLSGLADFKEVGIVRKKAAGFLLGQKSDFWSFNYWERGSSDEKEAPYPDDLDDTFSALFAIHGYDQKIIKGRDMGKIVTLLTATEKKEGGPYATWLVPRNADKKWRDIDLAVNSNVASFLASQDVHLDSMDSLVESAVRKNEFISPYYYSQHSVIYFISRFYKGKYVKKIVDDIISKKRRDGGWGNVLETAFCVSALFNFGCDLEIVEASIAYLLKNESKWKKAYPFIIELVKGGNNHYSGAPALTAAFVLEALGKARSSRIRNDSFKSANRNSETKREMIHERIIRKTTDIFPQSKGCAYSALSKQAKKMSESYYAKNITLLPYEFHKSLDIAISSRIGSYAIEEFGVANLLGWIAYSAYDDFYDGEGKASELPAANLCLLELTAIFMKHAAGNKDFLSLFHEIMISIEDANLWEMENCRASLSGNGFHLPKRLPAYSDYSRLADRSMGHALGPIAIASMLGFKKRSSAMNGIVGMFRCYIIAKQLNDDAHDWEEDIRNGSLTPVVCMILKIWRKKNKNRTEINLSKDIRTFQEIFWYQVIGIVCKDILSYAAKAREQLGRLDMVENKDFFDRMIEKEENSAKKAIEERSNTLDFIRSFDS